MEAEEKEEKKRLKEEKAEAKQKAELAKKQTAEIKAAERQRKIEKEEAAKLTRKRDREEYEKGLLNGKLAILARLELPDDHPRHKQLKMATQRLRKKLQSQEDTQSQSRAGSIAEGEDVEYIDPRLATLAQAAYGLLE